MEGHMKRVGLLLSVICLLFPFLACADKENYTRQLFLVSIYDNSANDCYLLSTQVLKGGLHKNRVPVYIPAGTTAKFLMVATQKNGAIVRLTYECGAGHQVTFVSFSHNKSKPTASGSINSTQNMRAYYNTIAGINLHTIDWVLEVV